MNGNTRKIALTTIAFGATVALAAACGSKKSGGTPASAVVTRGNGNPADFSCNHSFADLAVVDTNVGARIHAVSQLVSGATPDLPGTRLVDVTVATLASNGTAAITDAGGIGTLAEKANSRYALLAHHDPDTSGNYIDTYGFNFLAPAIGNTTGTMVQRVIPETVYTAFVSLLGIQGDLSNTFQVAGAVGDCTDQGAQIANATVTVAGAHLCSESPTAPCIAYIQGTTTPVPNVGAKHTDANGAFIIVGLPAGTPATIEIFGVTTEGQAAEQIGELTVNGKPGTIALGASTPLRQ